MLAIGAGILDAVHVSGAVSKDWVSAGGLYCTAPGETQVSANNCCDYPSPGCGPGSGMNCRGSLKIQGTDDSNKNVQGPETEVLVILCTCL